VLNPAGTRQFHPQVVIPSADLSRLLGFPVGTYPPTPLQALSGLLDENPNSILGSLAPQINLVNSILLRSKIINASISIPNNLLALVPLTASFGAVNQYSANIPVYSPVQSSSYTNLEVSFCDQNLQPLFFCDGEITLKLHIRDKK
jgi:hypothetical protein